ncbi:MAG: UDP-N-acetylmuramate dehydrogenase [Firmicutes bacterium]|nr:UDP-N-acetylmuramate dehydrogenase [Bacillota bacterium]
MMKKEQREIIENLNLNPELYDITYDIPASKLDTFCIGGVVGAVVYPKSVESLVRLLQMLLTCDVKHAVIGRGSNILVADDGYDGVFVMTGQLKKIKIEGSTLTSECGAPITQCALFAKDAGLSGLEFAYGIPGSVGGAVYMNAGAYGGEIKNIFSECVLYDERTDETITRGCDLMDFSYRESALKHEKLILLSASFTLVGDDPERIMQRMMENMNARREKQPLEYPSAGSVFKRCAGYYTAKLIDEAGLKGCRIGGAEVSEKHAGFIVNRGGATANDVLYLIKLITNRIYELHGITLEREIIYLD